MPARKGNRYAAHAGRHHEAQITLRIPAQLKYRARQCQERRNMKLSPWLTEAITEKCDREEQA